MRLPSAPALLSRDIFGSGGRNRTYDLQVMSLASYLCSTPQCIWYKKQDLHLHGLVTYQPTSDEVMSIYRLSSRFERFHHSCSFYNLQYVKELFKGQIFLNPCLLYQNIRCCFRCSDKILNFFQNFWWRRGESNPRLAQAV